MDPLGLKCNGLITSKDIESRVAIEIRPWKLQQSATVNGSKDEMFHWFFLFARLYHVALDHP
jgi:hypothetical protein